jgi:patatin-like phospholipase/acyl hydrolase
VPGFMSQVDLFAGTSAGGINSLLFASLEDPAPMLEVAANFWRNPQKYYTNSLPGYLRALVGLGAVNNSKYVEEFLDGVLGDRTLEDLKKKVLCVSFDLNPLKKPESTPGPLNWKAKIFENLTPGNPDLEKRAVDVALSTSASPIVTAIHQSKVDGGLVANNPAMCALSQIEYEHRRDVAAPDMRQVLMLSVGQGRAQEVLKVYNANWGYVPWLLNVCNPLLLVNAFLSASLDAVTYQSMQVLPDGQFFRLDPFYADPGVIPFLQVDPAKIEAAAQSPDTKAVVANAIEWVQSTNWMAAA